MRIKINDKIYRLKEIESGVDSLMELVEEPRYKDGDFLHSDWNGKNITIIYRKINGNHLYYHVAKSNLAVLSFNKDSFWSDDGDFRLATESEKKELIDALAEVGKRWNTEKKCIEDTRVYRDGDFVVSEFGSILIFKKADGVYIFDHAYLPACGELIIDETASYEGIERHATTEEKQRMINALAERGKRWNAEKKCIEDISVYKDGDFVVNDSGSILIFKEAKGDCIFNHAYLYNNGTFIGVLIINGGPSLIDIKRHATTKEKQRIIDALAKKCKRWNNDKKCVEDIPKRKFNAGDKVTLKSGCTSNSGVIYLSQFDEYIGEKLIVIDYTESGNVKCNNGFRFHEDWLEPWSDEPEVGDWVIAWNNDMSLAVIGVKINATPMQGCKHVLNNNNSYKYAVKFNGTRDHLEKIRSGKV